MCIQSEFGKNIDNPLVDEWEHPCVWGEEKTVRPDYCVFNNTAYGLDLLHKHIKNNSRIVLSTDVDVDGVGTTYIMKRTLNALGSDKHIQIINQEKIHGIQQKHVEYFKMRPVDLIIITDSSCNEIETIKKFNCDVLVIDHHELLHNDLIGYCEDGIHRYVIINNTIDNYNQEFDNMWIEKNSGVALDKLVKYEKTNDMSCGLVVYELMRVYSLCFNNELLLENMLLDQWVGITLFTDVISTTNKRNQWYMDRTVFNVEIEETLGIILRLTNKYKGKLDKSYIQYTFAPIINKAIRAGKSGEVVSKIINYPEEICELNIYNEMQQEAVEKATTVLYKDSMTGVEVRNKRLFNSENIVLDITDLDIHNNYTGVIASRLSGDNQKNALVFKRLESGKVKGSFRGKYKRCNYRGYFDNHSKDVYAQGHPEAFGFEVTKQQLDDIVVGINSIEPKGRINEFLTAGSMSEEEKGVYHITDMTEFRRQGFIWRIATGNAKVSSKEEIFIRVKSSDAEFKEAKGKLIYYNVLGLECKAFKPIDKQYINIYIEYGSEINIFIK
jgi:single-stranded DNA-specific DHH superfamily exonuclease